MPRAIMRAAATLYKADFLDGFYLDGSPAFEQWALMKASDCAEPGHFCLPTVGQPGNHQRTTGSHRYGQRLLQLNLA